MTIKEIIWLGGLPQLGRLPLLSGVSRVHVNKPLVSTIFTTPPDIGSFFLSNSHGIARVKFTELSISPFITLVITQTVFLFLNVFVWLMSKMK